MPLTLVLGPANSAKAGEVLGAYAAAARRDALLVVPTAADALHYDRELAADGASPGRALTFAGLLELIAARTGFAPPRLSALSRDLLIRRTIAATPLDALAASARAPGFPAAVGGLLGELAAQRITPQRLSAALARRGGDRVATELATVLGRVGAALSRQAGLDNDAFAWAALDELRAAPAAWGRTPVFLYGFDDLTPVELDAVETLAHVVAVPVTVSLTFEADRPALAARADVVERLRLRAETVRELPPQASFYATAELHHLERHLFEADAPTGAAGAAVVLLEAGGERAEAELVAAEVLAALRAGVAPAEIVVLCRSLARSGALLEGALRRYGVPVASARRIPLAHTALGRGVAAVLTDEPLEFLRLTRPAEEVDRLEAAARRGGGRVRAPLPPLADALVALLPRAGAQGLTAEEELDVRAAGVLEAALEELGPLDPRELVELLERLEVPVGRDAGVLVAEPLTVRARRFARVVITGLCEGEFPRGDPPDPFLSEARRRELALEAGLVLAPPPDPAMRERYLLYASVSRATEQVCLSFRSADEDGNGVAASPFLDEIRRLFPDVPVRRRLLADVVWTPETAPTAREQRLAEAARTGAAPAPAGETRRLGRVALEHVRHTRRVSPGAMERFGACPVAWLVERQLEPEALEPDGDALVKGTFMHELLARILSGEPDVLQGLAPPAQLAPGEPPAVRAAILAGIVAELERYLRWEAEHPAPGFAPAELELAFEVELARGLALVGVVDRVDRDGHGRAIVRDYKSGRDRIERSAARWIAEHTFQVGLYMLAVQRVLGVRPVAGIYQPLAGRDLRPRGAALAEAGLPLRPGDVLEPEQLAELLGAVEAEVDRLAATLAAGELTPCPQTCSADGCRHPGICWAAR
ncbi:MAG TPA: PD-(D/E)XK nuclease family protein [Solirubrobacteraceae bacterium]|nr:PD-(D/E)XK nuclease family protein [Solirubrobacteraceae bacterium]